MKYDAAPTSYRVWPFRAEIREDGDVNNGGLDLVSTPELIDRVHEATDANGLRPLLRFLNRSGGDFQTLGCASKVDTDGLYYSYIEITLRDPNLAKEGSWPHQFERIWLDWLGRVEKQTAGLGNLLQERTAMEYRKFSFRENGPQLLISIFVQVETEDHHRQYCSYLLRFFQLLENGSLEKKTP